MIALTARILLTASALAVATAAHAQAPASDSAETGEAVGDAIVVTGSRIARPELDHPMPVSVVDMDEARELGLVTAWKALIREPAISPGVGRANAGSQGFDGGTASINLRNLGTNRTLTLIDGQRRVSGSARSSAVDLNMIPAGMIERIEVITGGAAAIYGSDAVTGAVNVITKKDIQGIEISATTGISERGDASTHSASFVAGSELADRRGSISIGGTYVNSEGFLTDDRDYANRHIVYQSNPNNTGPDDGISDTLTYYNWGASRLNVNPTFVHQNINYVYLDGAVKPQDFDRISAPGEFTGGAVDYYKEGILPLHAAEQLVSPLEQFAIIGRFDYDLTDTIHYTARFDYGYTFYDGTRTYIREDSRNTWLNGVGGAVATLDNPYLPDPIRQFMVNNDLTELGIARIYPEMGIRRDVQKRHSYTASSQLDGEVANDLLWNAFFQYGRSATNVSNPGTLRAGRWIAARDVISDPDTGAPVCRDEEARAAGCVPYNIFDRVAPTPEQRDWLFATRREQWVNTQSIFGASIVGPVFALPYGDVSIAVGGERRVDKLNTEEDPLAVAGELAHSSGVTQHAEIDATLKVSELYGELVVPVLRDLPFARRLEIEGAYRFSDYNAFGSTDTWKIGATWSPADGVTFRGVRSRSVRVPNFGELYEPVLTRVSNLDDPCEAQNVNRSPTRVANCQALGIEEPGLASQLTSQLTTGGNPDLMPETSNSLTLGVILQPQFLPGFDVTVDYWDIDIENVITQFSGNQIANYCVDLPTIDNIFCDAINRDQNDPVRAIETAETQQINASNLTARGLDVGMSYSRPIAEGLFSISVKGTYLIDKETEAVPGIEASILKQVEGYEDPRFRGYVHADYSIGAFNLAWNTQIRGASLYRTNVASDEAYPTNKVPSRIYNDVSLGYEFTEDYRLTIGVNNLFDVKPPQNPSTWKGAGGIFDTVGRYFFVSAQANF